MNAWQKLILISVLFVAGVCYAAAITLEKVGTTPQQDKSFIEKREKYQEIMQFLQGDVSDNSVTLALQLLPSIKDYPLYPYAWYRALIKQSSISLTQLQQFLTQNADFPLNNALIDQFYQKAFQQKNWQHLLSAEAKIPTHSVAQQCIRLVAQQQQHLDRQETLTRIWQQTETLWLSGNTLPKVCDPLVTAWQKTPQFKQALIVQRANLAVMARNKAVLTDLQRIATDNGVKRQLQQWQILLEKPQHLIALSDNWQITSQNKQILLHHFPYYLRTMPEQALNLAKLQQQLTQWQQKWRFSPDEFEQLKRAMIQRFFDNKQPQWLVWRDQQLQQLKDDALLERRLREAIRQQQPLSTWLALLSAKTVKKDEWQFWRAWQAQKQGETATAKRIWQQLSQQRGFYALLAAEALGIDYHPPMQDLATPVSFSPLWQQQPIKLALQRIAELRHFRYLDDAYREWNFLLKYVNQQQALLLSEYALRHHWYDLAVAATIQAKAWGYLRLRLPLAYEQWFEINTAKGQISRSFAMAIARQESAWRANVRSAANAVGLMQLLPSTAKEIAAQAQYSTQQANKLTDPLTNILLGTAHLAQLAKKYGDNRLLIAAAYNAGANRVDRWLADNGGKLSLAEFAASIPFYETRNYVQNVISYDYYYQILSRQPAKKFSKTETDRLY